jgi:glyoxylase-like metal-dependent hydrolase (beta-lactamase superfamily II)
MRIGAIDILPIFDGGTKESATDLLIPTGPDVDPSPSLTPFIDDEGRFEMTMGGYLIRTSDRTIVVDAGLGPLTVGNMVGGAFLESLAALGVQPGDVTDVLLTHLHFDHVGWCTQQGTVVFPNATHRCHAADWNHFVSGPTPDAGATRKLEPITPLLETFDHDMELAPGISVRHAPGHTPGSTIVVASAGTERALLIGDIAHCPAELTSDDWETVFDVDPKLATATRAALARELEDGQVHVAAAHFPNLVFGRLIRAEGQRRWVV